jgi:hypothetical protein
MKTIFNAFAIIIITNGIIIGQNAQYLEYQGTNPQGLHTYGNAINFPNNLIADDYGPRQLDAARPYDWHGGIDFNGPGGPDSNDEGDIILAIEGGIVSDSSQVNSSGFKWITVVGTHNISYEHIVADGSIGGTGLMVGGCITKNLDNAPTDPIKNWAIIFQINGVYHAIGPINGSTVTFADENGTSQTLTVTNSVAQGAPIAPLGGSGGFSPHAHIQGMSALTKANGDIINPGSSEGDKYGKNPLEYITHTSPTFIINLSQQGIASGVSPVYPGNKRTPLLSTATLSGEVDGKRYNNSIIDIEKVEYKIKNIYSTNWVNIKGINADKIQFGGRGTDNVKPDKLRTQGVGNWNTTGVKPHTYWNHNYDEFYFADFYARIHKNDPMSGKGMFADYPWSAMYKDGNYEIKVAISNVNDAFPDNWSPGLPFSIDNFNPFIYGANAWFSNGPQGQPVYARYWEPTSGGKINLGLRASHALNPIKKNYWQLLQKL